MMRCAVIIPTFNGAALTGACLEALLASPPTSCDWRIIVVDDGSSDGTHDALARFGSQIELLEQRVNGGFARACNAGAQAAGDCHLLVFLNNDTLPTAGWLDALVNELRADEQVGAVGAKLLFPNGQVQHAGVTIGRDGWPHHLYAGFDGEHPAVNRAKRVVATTAACVLVRQTDFAELGGFDTAFHNGYEDVDLCLRLGELGRTIRYCPRSVVYHLESITRWPSGVPQGTEVSDRVYREKWAARVQPDDLEHYTQDGLLSLAYGPYYPMTLSVAPELAVLRSDGAELSGLERLLAVRSKQVMELVGAHTRDWVSSVASHPDVSARGPLRGDLVRKGREHVLGGATGATLVSVVIPVKDGEPFLEELLPAVLAQTVSARLEIVAVDSGSSDGSIRVLEQFGATVLAIRPDEFDHGLARVLAAEHARGDVLVFLTQRALPVDDHWLAPLLATLDRDPVVAGVCSRVVPRDDADILTRRDVERDLSGATERTRKQIADRHAYETMSPEARRSFLNFHTVSAAIRTEVWRQTPFRAVRTLGEDLQWAREVIEAGWALVHEPASVVRHSHDYTLGELFARNVEDGIANRDIIERSLALEQVVPMIRAMALDDWSYLRNTLGVEGVELAQWQLEATLRRTAQGFGQWLGINYRDLPPGAAERFSSQAQRTADRGPS